jgi:SAM-dependent methyltransferase
MSILDVGCGPGTLTADLAAAVAPGPVVAVEPTAEALALARTEVSRRGLTTVRFVEGDAHALPFDDGAFDVVHAHQVLQHLADPVAALREFGRVCRPGGLVAARDSDYAAFAWYPELSELDDWRALYRAAARANGGEPDAGRRLLAWARAAGFTDVTASAGVWCFADPVDRDWWGGLWADRIRRSDLATQLVTSGAAGPADLDRIAAGWRRWAAAPDGWLTVPHGEILARAPARVKV